MLLLLLVLVAAVRLLHTARHLPKRDFGDLANRAWEIRYFEPLTCCFVSSQILTFDSQINLKPELQNAPLYDSVSGGTGPPVTGLLLHFHQNVTTPRVWSHPVALYAGSTRSCTTSSELAFNCATYV